MSEPTNTDRAFTEGYLRLDKSGKTEKIVYVAVGHSERWSDPEEKVRAEFYAELIYKYGYAPQRIPSRRRRSHRIDSKRATSFSIAPTAPANLSASARSSTSTVIGSLPRT